MAGLNLGYGGGRSLNPQASSYMGNPYHAEGAIDFTPTFGDGSPDLDTDSGRQDVPGSQNVLNGSGMVGNQFPIAGMKVDNGPVMDGVGDEGNERQDVPTPDPQGGLDRDGCGVDLDWNAVAPYQNPEYPGAANVPQTGFAGSLRGGGPLAPPRD